MAEEMSERLLEMERLYNARMLADVSAALLSSTVSHN